MFRINIFGGPGAGKSTLAAQLFADYKPRCGVEIITEACKLRAYKNEQLDEWDQLEMFSRQLAMERNWAETRITYLIIDSPLLLQCFYASRINNVVGEHMRMLAAQFEWQYPSINFLLERKYPYVEKGRFQTADEALQLDDEIKDWCEQYVNYSTATSLDDMRGVVFAEHLTWNLNHE